MKVNASDGRQQHFGLNYIATSVDTDGRYFQCSTTIPPGDTGPPPHTHANECEGFYVTAGKLKLTVDGKTHVLNTGDFFNVAPNAVHSWFNDSDEHAELIITFVPGGIEDMFRELGAPDADFPAIGLKYGMKVVI